MTYKLKDLADVIRSKNAGPYELTFDIMFKTEEIYKAVAASGAITKSSFAALYNIAPEAVMEIVHFHPAKAIKITIARPVCSGDLRETDVYGAQQHAPLMNFAIDINPHDSAHLAHLQSESCVKHGSEFQQGGSPSHATAGTPQ